MMLWSWIRIVVHLGRERRAGYSLNGSRFSHFFILIVLSDNRNSKIYQWKEFYWEFSCIKIQYVGTERQTDVLINNKYTFACSEEELLCVQKCKQVCVSKLLRFISHFLGTQRKRSNGNLVFLFTSSMKNIYDLWNMSRLHDVDYGFNNNKHAFA